MGVENPTGPLVLCYDGSEAAERAIRIAPVLVGPGRAARVFYAYKPTERSLGVAQALTGGSIDAPVHGESEGLDIVARGVAIARDAGFEAEPLLTVADRRTAEIIADTAEELDAPAVVMGQRGMSGLKSAVLGSVSRDVSTRTTGRSCSCDDLHPNAKKPRERGASREVGQGAWPP